MELHPFPTNRDAVSVVMGKPPANVAKVVAAWNAAHVGQATASAVAIKRPSGHVNHHLRMALSAGERRALSLGATDDMTVTSGLSALFDALTKPALRTR